MNVKLRVPTGPLPVPLIVCAALAGAVLFGWLAQFDPFYRTIFIEEYHSGEAGRAAFLFGSFQGEGGGYQSKVAAPAASLLSWLSFEVFGLGRFQLRLPFILLSVGSIAAFGHFLRRETGENRLLAVAALVAFVLSPFLINLRPTSLNETLFVSVLTFALAVAGAFEGAPPGRSRLILAFILAFGSGLAVFVKFDGVLIPAAVAFVFLSAALAGRVSPREVAAFAAGGVAVLLAYIAMQLWASGVAGLQASLAWGAASLKNVTYWPDSPFERVVRTLVWAPKNLNLFFPGISLLVCALIGLGAFAWRDMSLAGRISAAVAIAFFAAAPFLPLVYWKRVLFAAPAVFALAIAVCAAWDRMPEPAIKRAQRLARFVLPVSVLVGTVAIVSPFRGMWRVEVFGQWGPKEIALLGLGLALAAASSFVTLDRARLQAIVVALSVATTGFGLIELTINRNRDSAAIGHEVGEMIDGSFVVADHNAFRIAGYFTDARFLFVHENDGGFPNLIVKRTQELHPDYVVVTDAYRKLGDLVRSRLPEYELVLEKSFANPPSYFRRVTTEHVIRVFKRKPDAPEQSAKP